MYEGTLYLESENLEFNVVYDFHYSPEEPQEMFYPGSSEEVIIEEIKLGDLSDLTEAEKAIVGKLDLDSEEFTKQLEECALWELERLANF